MGAGKTTLGKAMAKELGLQFCDLDWFIEERFHKTIPQIFESRGEEGFREIERNILHEVGEFEDIIISCGGGTPCFYDNIDFMNSKAQTVYLKAAPETLFAHLKMSKTERPLLKNKSDEELIQFIRDSLEKREPYYKRANYIFDVSLLNTYDKIKDHVHLIQKLLNFT